MDSIYKKVTYKKVLCKMKILAREIVFHNISKFRRRKIKFRIKAELVHSWIIHLLMMKIPAKELLKKD